uniref:Uncharacterized protein n=1 Tax=Oryza glaberrima TaxID=4538 RepID=A0A1V1H376_ORYGL|nr:hypothetical protein [Oryza glaberrima]
MKATKPRRRRPCGRSALLAAARAVARRQREEGGSGDAGCFRLPCTCISCGILRLLNFLSHVAKQHRYYFITPRDHD